MRQNEELFRAQPIHHGLRHILGINGSGFQKAVLPAILAKQHARPHTPRAYARHVDSGIPVLHGDPLRQSESRMLGNGIGYRANLRQQPAADITCSRYPSPCSSIRGSTARAA